MTRINHRVRLTIYLSLPRRTTKTDVATRQRAANYDSAIPLVTRKTEPTKSRATTETHLRAFPGPKGGHRRQKIEHRTIRRLPIAHILVKIGYLMDKGDAVVVWEHVLNKGCDFPLPRL